MSVTERQAVNVACTVPGLNMITGGIGAIVNIKGAKSHGNCGNALKIVENLEYGSARMPKVRQVILLESYYRYPTFFSKSS